MNFKKMDFTEKFGQMIMLGLDTYEINDEIISLIRDYKIGGVVLYKKNYTSLESMIEFINKLKSINSENKIPLFIAIDQENGVVNRLPKDIVNMYSAKKQVATHNLDIINSFNELTTYLLKSVGVNMNFAPVLDIEHNNKSKVLEHRCYGKTKEEVIKYALPFMKSMKNANIISVVKHFPGHGLSDKDSHVTYPRIKNNNVLDNCDIIPFKEAILNGCDAVMTGHIKIKGYGLNPCSTNKRIIQEKLLNNCKYNGFIITDDLRMGLNRYKSSIKKKIIKAVEAGNNVLLVKYKKNDIKNIYKPIYNLVNNYEIDIEKIDNSAKKIIAMKKKYQITDEVINTNLNIKEINKRIKNINKVIDKELKI